MEQLELLWQWRGTAAAAVSVDDFYLTYKDQCALGAANPDNRLLQLRGNAGGCGGWSKAAALLAAAWAHRGCLWLLLLLLLHQAALCKEHLQAQQVRLHKGA